ncbi:MAG: phasin family protein [Magnetovibrio sp.]|nr:phasin family protein [Magnetovibrio sp.]
MSAKKKASAANSAVDAIDAAAENFDAAANMIKDGVDAAIKAGSEQAKSAQNVEGFDFLGRDNIDAAVKAGEAYVAGFQTMNDLFFKAAKEAVHFNTEAAKTLSGCKTPEEISETQLKLAQSGFEVAVETSTEITQTAMKLANEIGEPLVSQFGTAYKDLVSKTAA